MDEDLADDVKELLSRLKRRASWSEAERADFLARKRELLGRIERADEA